MNNGINYLETGAGFQPLTVVVSVDILWKTKTGHPDSSVTVDFSLGTKALNPRVFLGVKDVTLCNPSGCFQHGKLFSEKKIQTIFHMFFLFL